MTCRPHAMLIMHLFILSQILSPSLSHPAVMAKHDPIITGLSSNYEEGQTLDINCTSDLSYPPAELIWYINDKEVSASEPRLWP